MFGTDGIRGIANQDLKKEIAYKIGKYISNKRKKIRVLIGNDTRESKDYIKLSIILGIIENGGDVDDVLVCPTPIISYLTRSLKYDYGISITASHNKKQFNGIKIFAKDGEKLDKKIQNKINKYLIDTENDKNANINLGHKNIFGTYNQKAFLKENYKDYIKSIFKKLNLKKYKIVLDCANGATCKIAPEIYQIFKSNPIIINNENDGKRINTNCGSEYSQGLIRKVIKTNSDLGVGFDGDGDRLILIDKFGNIIDGNKILYLLSNYLKLNNNLKNNLVATTIMANKGLEIALKEKGISIVKCNVGDQNVYNKMKKQNILLGGESCGHIILKDYSTSGDGILVSLFILKILNETKKRITELTNIKLFNQKTVNIKAKNKDKILNDKRIRTLIINNKKNNDKKIILRKSGTEDILRLSVETKNKTTTNSLIKEITSLISKIDKE